MKPFAVRLTAKPSEIQGGFISTNLFSPNEIRRDVTIASVSELEGLAAKLASESAFDCVVWIGAKDSNARCPRGFKDEARRICSIFHRADALAEVSA